MDLVNELENDLALAFLVEKQHAGRIDSREILILLDKVRKSLIPLSKDEKVLFAGKSESVLAH